MRTDPPARLLLVVNPHAGTGRDGILGRLRGALAERGADADVVLTDGPGSATHLTRTALADGHRLIVAVGGDGTVHEVVNGLVDADTGVARTPDAVLGVVAAGSGSDLVRTFGLDRPPEVLAHHLTRPGEHRIDLGRVRLTGADGRTTVRLFANIAEVGFGGRVAQRAARLPAALGERRYRAGIVLAWGGFRRVPMTLEHDGGVHRGELSNVVVANGQFFGGGLKVAPRSLPDDGMFDLQAWGGTVTDVLRASRQLRDGSHLARTDVRAWPTATVTVDADRPVAVEADGELLGVTPAHFDLLPHALTLKV